MNSHIERSLKRPIQSLIRKVVRSMMNPACSPSIIEASNMQTKGINAMGSILCDSQREWDTVKDCRAGSISKSTSHNLQVEKLQSASCKVDNKK